MATSGQVASITFRPRACAASSTAWRHAVGAEDGDAARRHLVDLLDEARTLGAQPLDHVPVMHDLVADVDRGAKVVKRPLDDLDRPLDAGAEASGLGQDDLHALVL